jgi:chaperonin GroEL
MKRYKNGVDLQEKIFKGINLLANNVASTLGPKGKNVLLYRQNSPPLITKDGVTIAKFVDLEDPFENASVQIVKQAAAKTADEAGDGTTTSTVLAREILNNARSYLEVGNSPVVMKRGMEKAVKLLTEYIIDNAHKISSIDDIKHIATISANGDVNVGELISTAVDKIGLDGAINIEGGRSIQTTLNVVEGFIFDSGYVSPRFVNNERKNSCEYENCLVLVTDFKVNTLEKMMPLLEVVAREGKPLIIVADEIEGQFLASLIMNVVRGSMKVVAVKAPKYGEERRQILEDMAIATGATFITQESGFDLRNIKLKHLGGIKKVEILRNSTIFVGGKSNVELLEDRINLLKERIKEEEDIDICKRYEERVTRLSSGIAIINVGAPTDIERLEKKHRVEDAVEAVRSAQVMGFHAGGGVSLFNAAKKIQRPQDLTEEEMVGFDIIVQSAIAPLRQMSLNSGYSVNDILNKLKNAKSKDVGINFTSGELCDMIEEGIIDPVKVTVCALVNAVSVAATLLTTNYGIVENEN